MQPIYDIDSSTHSCQAMQSNTIDIDRDNVFVKANNTNNVDTADVQRTKTVDVGELCSILTVMCGLPYERHLNVG